MTRRIIILMIGLWALVDAGALVHVRAAEITAASNIPATQLVDIFADTIEKILGVENRRADVVTPLKKAILSGESTSASTQEKGNDLRALVEALLKGPDPDALMGTHFLNQNFNVNYEEDPTLLIGTLPQRRAIVNRLWKLALEAEKTDKTYSARLGKAWVILAALNDDFIGWQTLDQFRINPDRTKQVLNLGEPQYNKLAEFIKSRMNEDKAYVSDVFAAQEVGNKLLDEKPLDGGDVTAALKLYDHAMTTGPQQDGYHKFIITEVWKVANLARDDKDDIGEALVTSQMMKWKETVGGANVRRWLDQALKARGPRPGLFIGHGVMQPDGTIKSTDKKS